MNAVNYQWEVFQKQGLPTRQHERWKYADLAFLANKKFSPVQVGDAVDPNLISRFRLDENSILLVMINGEFAPSLSDINRLPANMQVCAMREVAKEAADLLKQFSTEKMDAKKYPFAHLNATSWTDGLFIHVPPQLHLAQPLHLLSIVTDSNEFIANPQHLLMFGEGSHVTLLEEHVAMVDSAYLMNTVTTLILAKDALLTHYKIQNESEQAVHLAHTFVRQMENSSLSFTNFSQGSLFARDEWVVALQEPHANCSTAGFYQPNRAHQYVDHHIDIHHLASRTTSEMLYKGTVDQNARAVFNGRLYVEKDAQKIVAYQANHNLLLSNTAEIYSKPELEIYADDVKCKHGATTGQLDLDALFYLRSRGIDEADARAILLQGFAEEIMQRVTHANIRARVGSMRGDCR